MNIELTIKKELASNSNKLKTLLATPRKERDQKHAERIWENSMQLISLLHTVKSL